MWDNPYMPRPPIGPFAMTHTVKFRLTDREFDMLQKIAKDASLSVALRQMVHDEWDRQKGKR
jgi:hypothetical protein